MAEALGAAVLTVSVDDTALRAGLAAAEQQAQRSATAIQRAFDGLGGGLGNATGDLRAYREELERLARQTSSAARTPAQKPPLPPPISPDLLRPRGGAVEPTRAIEAIGTSATIANRAVTALVGALGGLSVGAAAFGFLKGSVDAAVQLETITRKLTNTLGDQGAAGALAFTRGIADQLGLSFKDLAGSFGSFTAAATAANVPLQVQKDLFASVARAGQSLGLSNFEINGSLLALQQVASKGTVQMEELRGQLGERLPIALSATARGLGLTQRELIKLVETGRLTADQFFPALTKGLNELTAGAQGIPTAAQNFQKLANAWDELQTSFGQNLLPGITEAVKGLTGVLEGRAVVDRAARLGFGQTQGPLGLGDRKTAFSAEAGQIVGTLRQLETQYGLTEKESTALFKTTAALAGVATERFGGLVFTAKQYEQILSQLPEIARKYRADNPDQRGIEQAKAAAEAAQLEKDRLAEVERQKTLDRNLTTDTISLELRGIQARIDGTKQLAGLEGDARQRVEDRLAIEERLRAAQQARLALARELEKPAGAGDGKEGTQSRVRVAQLEGEVIKANLAVDQERANQAAQRVQRAREELELTRQQQAAVRANLRASADSQIDIMRQINDAQSGINTDPLRATERLQQQLGRGVADAAIAASRAAKDFEAERQRQIAAFNRGGRLDVGGLSKLKADADVAGARLELAAATLGESLRNNAKEAAKTLQDAISSRNSTLRGNFDVLTDARQREQIDLARREVQAGVNRGDIRTGLPIGTIDQLFGLANAANQINQANEQVKLAERLKTSADAAVKNADALFVSSVAMGNLAQRLIDLEQKDWAIGVTVNANGSAAVSGDASLAYR